MTEDEDESKSLRASALKTAASILIARQRAELELRAAKATLQRQTEELQQQREWLEVTLSSIGDGVIAADLQGRVTFMNPVAAVLTGWSSNQACGTSVDEVFRIVREDTGAVLQSPVLRVLESGRTVTMGAETVLVAADGRRTAIDNSAAPMRDAHGGMSGAVMVFHDITQRRSNEAALHARDALLRATFDQAAVGIAVAERSGRFVEVNRKFCDMVGYSAEELYALRFEQLIHADDLAETERRMEALSNGAISRSVQEKRYRRKDGSEVWVRTTATLMPSANARSERYVGIIEDITARRQAEEALLDEKRALELLNSSGTSLAGELELEVLVQRVTDAATELSGAQFGAFFYTVTDLRGESLSLYALSGAPHQCFQDLGMPRNTAVFEPTFRDGKVVRSADITADPRYGQLAPHYGLPVGHPPLRSYLAVPVTSRAGGVIGTLFFGHSEPGVFNQRAELLVVGIAAQAAVAIDNAKLYEAAQREISRRVQAEQALHEIDRRKDEFLATLAHELRNPLAPIRQAALIAKAAGATEAQRRWGLDVIGRQTQHMALLLDDLLDISRITRGTLVLRVQMADLAAIIDEAVETSMPLINSKRHCLKIETPGPGTHIAADGLRLAQVLSNLLTNAAKYTDEGGTITLRAICTADSIVICVTDSGIGIAAESLEDVFSMFSQVKSSQDRSEGGLGIGLALARGLVELHGGSLEVSSAGSGCGSEFLLRLPRRSLPDSPGAPVQWLDSGVTARRRVLIADDNRDAADSLAALMRLNGHDVRVVYDGQAAVDACAHALPEIALLDIGMPRINGYEVARQVRAAPFGQAVTLIAVTGWGQSSDKALATEAGFDHHFTKPIDPAQLSELLRQISA